MWLPVFISARMAWVSPGFQQILWADGIYSVGSSSMASGPDWQYWIQQGWTSYWKSDGDISSEFQKPVSNSVKSFTKSLGMWSESLASSILVGVGGVGSGNYGKRFWFHVKKCFPGRWNGFFWIPRSPYLEVATDRLDRDFSLNCGIGPVTSKTPFSLGFGDTIFTFGLFSSFRGEAFHYHCVLINNH